MKKGLWWAASLLVVVALLMGGCAGHPKGMKSLRWLTDDEKDRVIEIALNSPKALEWRRRESKYEVKLEWIGITWANSEPSGVITYPYERMEKVSEELFQSSQAVFPGVSIYFGEPPQWEVNVAVDLDTETAIDALDLPLTPPTPPRPH